jgi:ATP-dependent DNA ligase
MRSAFASFNRVRYRHHDESIFLYAFDLIELNGDDMRRDPLEVHQIHAAVTGLVKSGVRACDKRRPSSPRPHARAISR